jgi:hypothetical protein
VLTNCQQTATSSAIAIGAEVGDLDGAIATADETNV